MKILFFTLAGAAVSLLAACVSPQPSPTPPSQAAACNTFNMQAGMPQLLNVSIQSSDLAQMIGVQEYFLNRTGMGTISANTTVYNCTELDIHLIFRARFSGERGETEAPSGWMSIILPPRGARSYGETAINTATTRVSIDIADGNRAQVQFGQPQLGSAPVAPAAAPTPPSN